MRRAQEGDAVAYGELLEAVRVILTVYIRSGNRRLGRHDEAGADDLVQEVLLALHAKRHTYDPAQPFMPWLLAIARYKVIDAWRAQRRRREDDVVPEELPDRRDDAASDAAARVDVDALLAELPPKTRALVEQVKLEGLSVAEVASRAKMSESAVKVAVHRALKSLRAKLSGGEREP